MPVAKSYKELEQLTEPYIVSGRYYVKVRMKNGSEKQVRFYNEREYAKMYPEEVAIAAPANDKLYKTQKEVLGFEKGYITIFKGETFPHLEWFHSAITRYNRWFGWYVCSTDEIPEDLPADLVPVRLPWEAVGNEDGSVKSEDQMRQAVDALIYDEGGSEYVGTIGERIEVAITVKRQIELENGYGTSNMHIMEDDCGNVYVWTTAAKNWPAGTEKIIRGTVKDHRTFRNVKQTVLNRCLEIK